MSRIDEIEERLSKTTPSPWVHKDGVIFHSAEVIVGTDRYLERGVVFPDDGAFIAAAPDDVRWLLARVRDLEDALDGVVPFLTDCRCGPGSPATCGKCQALRARRAALAGES